MHRSCSAFDYLLVGEIGIDCLDLHSEGFGLGSDQPSDISESLDSESLSLKLDSCGRSELVPGHVDHHGKRQFGHCIGILAWSILHYDLVGSSRLEIDIVESGACTYHYLEFRGRLKHSGSHLVRADYDGICIRHGEAEISLRFISLQQGHFMTGPGEYGCYAVHGFFGERLLGCN